MSDNLNVTVEKCLDSHISTKTADNSPAVLLVGDMLKQVWFDALSIREELLSEIERLEAEFIFAGLVHDVYCCDATCS